MEIIDQKLDNKILNFQFGQILKMKKNFISIICLTLSISCSKSIEISPQKPSQGVYEMRVYYTHEGKFKDIISRFENHTTKL